MLSGNIILPRLLSLKSLLFIVVLGLFSVLPGLANAALIFSFNAMNQSGKPGEAFQVEWVVVNNGGTTENNVSVEVPMPASGIAWIYKSLTDGGDCPSTSCDPGETIVWSLGNLPAGESRVANFSLVVDASAPNGGIGMSGRLVQSGSVVESSSWTQEVSAASVAQLSIDSSEALIAAGQTFSIGFLAGNSNTAPLDNAVLTVPVPAAFSIDSAPGGTVSGNSVSWNLGNLPAGRVTRRVVNVTLNPGAVNGDLILLDDASLSGTAFGIPQTTYADHVVRVGEHPLKFHIRAQETQLTPGEAHQMELVVSNTSNQVVQNASVQLLYPQGLAWMYVSLTDGGSCPSTSCDSGEQLVWTFGNFLPGETKQVIFKTAASASATPGIPVRWQGRLQLDSNVLRSEYLAIGNSSVDINLQIDTDETQVLAGDNYIYTFHIGNTGAQPMDRVDLSVPIPDGVSVLDSYGGTTSAGTVSWQLNDVSAGEIQRRYLRVQSDNSLSNGSIINLTEAEASTVVFGVPQATMAQHFTSIGDTPVDLEVRIQQPEARPAEVFSMEIVASNTGQQVEQNVTASLLYPDELNWSYVSLLENATCPSTSCDPGEHMDIPFGNLTPGETKSIVINLSALNAASDGEHSTWMGHVGAAGGLSRRFESTLGITDTPAELYVGTEDLLAIAGSTVRYQIAAGNSGLDTLSQSRLLVPVPEGMSVVSSPLGTLQNGRVVYELGDIQAGEIHLRDLILTVPAGVPDGTQYVLENIELTGFMFGLLQLAGASHVMTVGDSPLVGQVSVTPVDAKAGDPIQVSINVSNTGSQIEQDVSIFLRFPYGVGWQYLSNMDGGVCPSSSCDQGEPVIWSLGNLLPNESRTVNFTTSLLANLSAGEMIEWLGRVAASDVKQRRLEFASLVGDVVTTPPPATTCNGLAVTVDLAAGQTATSGADVILGTSGADVIYAYGGDDVICAGEGADTIYAGNGDDWVDAGPGNDLVQAGGGIDRVYGDQGDDELYGGPDGDFIYGEEGNDYILGNSGSDTIEGGDGVDRIKGGSGNDTIETGSGATVGSGVIVDGGSGNDTITGGPDADEIRGSTDDDFIRGGGGDDRLFGGGGNDTVEGQSGDDFIRGNAANDTLNGGADNDNVDGGSGHDTVIGGAGADVLAGATGNDILRGQTGDDTIIGGGGNDMLYGDGGADLLLGGGSNDTLDGGGSNDTCDGQGGIDTATASCEIILNVP